MKQLDEKVILRNVLSGSVSLFFSIIVLYFVILFLVTGERGLFYGFPITRLVYGFLFLYLSGIYLIWLYNKHAYRFHKYKLEESYFKIEKGILWKIYKSVPYKKIQNIDLSRGIFDRLLGLSNLNIQTAGSSAQGRIYEASLPGLSVQTAQDLQKELTKKVSLSS